MVAAFIVYYSIIFSFAFFSRYIYISKRSFGRILLGYMIPIFIAAILLGGRYNTGSDWENYKEYYDELLFRGISFEEAFSASLEPAYLILNKCIAFFNVGSSVFFAVVVILQFSVVYLLYRNKSKLLPYALFFYTMGNITLNMNIVRQTLAMSILFLSLKYASNNKIKFLVLYIVSVGFHYSAIIFLPVIILNRKWFKFLDQPIIVIVLYISSFVLAPLINQILTGFIQMIEFGDKYSRNSSNIDSEMELASGYGLVIKHFLEILLIYLWHKMKLTKVDEFHMLAYRVTIVGLILANIFGLSVFMARVALYYSHAIFILWALLFYNIFNINKYKKYYPYAVGILILDIAVFSVGIINGNGGCSPYMFKWIF